MKRAKGHWVVKLLIVLAVIALALFGVWRWAIATGSAATLDRIDGRFSRERGAEMVAAAHYGSDPAQRVELWRPSSGKVAAPLVVFVHGGGWHSGRPEDYRFVARSLGALGYAVALVGYRLVPEGRYPAMLEDSAAGVAWVARHASAHGLDAGRMALAGHSAGAYNVMMLTLDPRWLAAAGVPETAIAGTIGLAGPYDFYPFTSDSARNALGHVNPPQQTQPISFARGDAPPLLLVHGTEDTVVRIRNTRRLADAISAAGGASEVLELPGSGHAWPVMALARPFDRDPTVRNAVARFLESLDEEPVSAAVQAGMR